jgi:hypothetical protein
MSANEAFVLLCRGDPQTYLTDVLIKSGQSLARFPSRRAHAMRAWAAKCSTDRFAE